MRHPAGAYDGRMQENATDMQHKVKPDYGQLRALFVKGLSLVEIAKRFDVPYSTLRSRAYREEWNTTAVQANNLIVQDATEKLKHSAANWIGKIDTLVHAAVDNVMQRGVSKLSIRDLNLALECADKANRMARVNFGLDADNGAHPRVQVNVAVLGNNATTGCNQDVIDVDTLRAAAPAHPAGAAPACDA